MPDLFNEKNSNNIFDNAVKDDAMDLSEFITTPTTQKPTVETSPIDSALSDNTPKSNKELSPLAAELNRKKNAQLGATVTRKEMEDGKERTVFENPMADERRERMKATMDESEMLLKQRAAIIPLKQFESSTEYSQMVHEISLVRFDETGKAYFDYEKDSNGNNVIPKFIRLRTENDPPYSKENDYLVMNRDAENARRIADGKEPIPDSVPLTAKVEDIEHKEEDTKSKTINLIIDKTGLGTDFILNEDERKKMAEANEIRLTQVEVLDIASITTEKPERDSFTGKIGWTSYEKLERAILKASSRCQSAGDVCVNEFFDEAGVPEWELVPVGEKWGWEDADLDKGILPVTISSIVVDGRPCLYLDLDRYAHRL